MATNPYFNQWTFDTEQNLVQDLMDEAIQIHGVNTYYLPREDQNLDRLLGEDDMTLYRHATKLEMYVKDSTSFKGQSDFMSKFGLQIEDQCTFSVSVRRFTQVKLPGRTIPMAGDVIWVQFKQRHDFGNPQKRYLFEIKFVEDKEQLFQLGYLYTFELRCELMTYTHERIATGVTELANTADPSSEVVINVDGPSNEKVYVYELVFSDITGGDFAVGEDLYQGDSSAPSVTGTLTSANPFYVRDNVGTWDVNLPVKSLDSARVGTLSAVDDDPALQDAISDNTRTENEPDLFVIRGNNPRTS